MCKTLKDAQLRPVDLARDAGVSTQAIRNYEDEGIIPAARRGENGYRHYASIHLHALRAFIALIRATTHVSARNILIAFNEGRIDDAFELIDRAHLQLLKDRETIATVEKGLTELQHQHSSHMEQGRRAFSIGDLARRLGVTPATLRSWEAAGILSPRRILETGHRSYDLEDVRDAELSRLLRRGGQRLADIAVIIREVRVAGDPDALLRTVSEWKERANLRSRALMDTAVALSDYLGSGGERLIGESPTIA